MPNHAPNMSPPICSKRGSVCQRTANRQPALPSWCQPGDLRQSHEGKYPTSLPQLHCLLIQVSPWQEQLMLMWTRNVQETFNVFFSSFDVISVLSFIKNLITLFTFDLHFISAFHLLCLSQGKQELAPRDAQSRAADLSSHPLNFQINKINKTLPTSGMKGTSF